MLATGLVRGRRCARVGPRTRPQHAVAAAGQTLPPRVAARRPRAGRALSSDGVLGRVQTGQPNGRGVSRGPATPKAHPKQPPANGFTLHQQLMARIGDQESIMKVCIGRERSRAWLACVLIASLTVSVAPALAVQT